MELLIVVVVIAILAAITIVAYNGITANAKESALKADLNTTAKKVGLIQAETGLYPSSKPADVPDIIQYAQANSGQGFCATASKDGKFFHITESGSIQTGECPLDASMLLQTTTAANCPTVRTMKVDARDRHTYWVQKMADNRCWMLTNLAYAGGGDNSYGDVKNLILATSSNSYTAAWYYVHPSSNPTTYPAQPSIDTTGGGSSGRQYGYYYNWCAAMGNQQGVAVCLNAGSPAPNYSISICPDGWRLPTGHSSGDFAGLFSNIGGVNDAEKSDNLKSIWLAQQGGRYNVGFTTVGTQGSYWTSSPFGNSSSYIFSITDTQASSGSGAKGLGFPVRCIVGG